MSSGTNAHVDPSINSNDLTTTSVNLLLRANKSYSSNTILPSPVLLDIA